MGCQLFLYHIIATGSGTTTFNATVTFEEDEDSARLNVHKVDVAFRSAAGTVRVCVDGAGIPFSEEEAKKVLLEKEIEILVDLKSGDEGATAWGCDLTYDYVKINGDYRT